MVIVVRQIEYRNQKKPVVCKVRLFSCEFELLKLNNPDSGQSWIFLNTIFTLHWDNDNE